MYYYLIVEYLIYARISATGFRLARHGVLFEDANIVLVRYRGNSTISQMTWIFGPQHCSRPTSVPSTHSP